MKHRGLPSKEASLLAMIFGEKDFALPQKKCNDCYSIGGTCPNCGFDYIKDMGVSD